MLLAAQGLDNNEIAARLDTRREVLSKWRSRFFEEDPRGPEERLVCGETDSRSFLPEGAVAVKARARCTAS
ncbi:MAG: hypothetical protein M0T79_01410 [Actinomycetota bacterium]|nr:hypothetical protein [Actinomycetota bacterium]